mgnify:CR=1 FL=1
MEKKRWFHLVFLVALSLSVLLALSISGRRASAASCYADGCNGKDPYGTTCWNDAYNAVVKYGPSGSYFYNANKYSPGCVANWSHTQSTNGAAYLAAETSGVYTYHGTQRFVYVWNIMWDGRNTVCTRGYKGSAYKQYQWVTPYGCA